LWLNANYKSIIQKKLPAAGAKATDSLYQVQAGDVSIDLLGRRVVIADFELVPDYEHIARLKKDFNLPEILLKIHIDSIVIEDIAWGEVLRTKEIVCGSMEIRNPVVRVTRLAGGRDTGNGREPSRIQAIQAGRISILNPDVIFYSSTERDAACYAAKGGRIDLTEWRYDLRQPNDSSRLFYSSNTAFRLDTFFIRQPAGFSRTSSGAITYDQSTGRLNVKELRVAPTVSREEFYRRVGYQKEMYNVHFPSLSLQALDWQGLIRRGQLIAAGGRLSEAAINIYMNRLPPPNTKSKNGNFPQQLLMKLKMPVYIPKLDIANGKLAYTEKNYKTKSEGTVSITEINGAVRNITNMPARLRRNNTCVISLGGKLKGSDLQATFRLTLDSKAGAFTVTGRQGPMDGTDLNDITRPLALAEIRSLQVDDIQFNINGNESGARGTLTMRYKDLKVNLLEVEGEGLDKKDVTSFLTNKLLSHANNPEPGKALRIAHPYFERDETKSFFNLIWKTIFTGALQTASRKVVKLDKMVNNKQEKQEEERKRETSDVRRER
jgi:hypothetical protein